MEEMLQGGRRLVRHGMHIIYSKTCIQTNVHLHVYYTLYMNDIRGHKQGNTSEHLRQLFVEEKYNTIHKASLNNYTNVAIIMNSISIEHIFTTTL